MASVAIPERTLTDRLRPTNFTFRLEKLVHALAFFSKEGVRDLTKLKAAKLLYFADKDHLLNYGRPILRDVYFCMKYGPVPSVALNEMNDAIATPEVESDSSSLRQVLKIHKPFFSKHPVFVLKGQFDESVFSLSEIESLQRTVDSYGKKTAEDLVGLSHRDKTWKVPNQQRDPEGRVLLPYELFFLDASPEAKEMFDVSRAEQEELLEFNRLTGD